MIAAPLGRFTPNAIVAMYLGVRSGGFAMNLRRTVTGFERNVATEMDQIALIVTAWLGLVLQAGAMTTERMVRKTAYVLVS